MNLIYLLSIIYLMTIFMLYKKSDNKLCLISSIIYSICLLFCYNTFIVYLLYLLGINGSIILFSIINFLLGTIISIIIYIKEKKIQKYFISKKKLITFIILGIIIFLVGFFRYRGFEAIAFESGDSAIHYSHALKFKDELSILDINNSRNDVEGYYVRIMPISYINCGLLFNMFSNVDSYIVFLWYNVLSLILCSLLFLVTIIDSFKLKKKDYIYGLFFSLLYTLAFPLNNFMMGFCYLSLGIMTINLLYLTIYSFKDKFNEDILFKILVIFLITFSSFYSYYLFVPALYLSLGLYYIYLFKKKKISFKNMTLYGVTTLIIPFIIGFLYFFVTLFQDLGVGEVAKTINTWGYCYSNITPLFLFIWGTFYLGWNYIYNKKFNYLIINLFILSGYIFIFLILYLFKRADLYYFYKLFSMYWLLLLLFLGTKIINYKKYFYIFIFCLTIVNIFVYINPLNAIADYFVRSNIYSYNTRYFKDDKLVYDKEELELLERSIEYNNICKKDKNFLLLGNGINPMWAYFITNNLPVIGKANGNLKILYTNVVPSFKVWEYNSDYPCLIYYYEGLDIKIDKSKYEILYENNKGSIIKRI